MPSLAYDAIRDDFKRFLLRMSRDGFLSGTDEDDDAIDLDASPRSGRKRVHPSIEEDTDNASFSTSSKKGNLNNSDTSACICAAGFLL